jgi:predicted nucleic acid-binding protein
MAPVKMLVDTGALLALALKRDRHHAHGQTSHGVIRTCGSC